ncbi:MAG: hypothetical protein ACLR2E_03330 [Lachnospiraceae bacterium]
MCEKRDSTGKMIPFGIPVSRKFRELEDQEKAKEELGFSPEKKLHLLIGGSMGAGNLKNWPGKSGNGTGRRASWL